ncbi:putative carboxylesterase 8 [Tasmannia lanceolata]|uniref:putative carboxylesterase 8 n=1 Tax=Tasmannia lanceolata TaxID=3420 RepID=UPI00406338AE
MKTGGVSSTENSNDFYGFLKIVQNPDGSITRLPTFPISPTIGEKDSISSETDPVFSKDVLLNPSHETSLRIFRPSNCEKNEKLPIIIYFHGGGFVVFSSASTPFHDSCEKMARGLRAIVVSVDYRLAPENPLPAAYEDAQDAILWVRDQVSGEPWLRDFGDFSRCFVMGMSSGGNIVYHAGLWAMGMDDLGPLKIVGLIFNQPFFGGVERTESELRLEEDQILPLRATDLMWKFSLPDGADRDHEFCNPMAHHGEDVAFRLMFPRCLVRGCEGDPLFDRQREFVKMMEKGGVQVVARFEEGGCHAVEFFDPQRAKTLLMDLQDFLNFSS